MDGGSNVSSPVEQAVRDTLDALVLDLRDSAGGWDVERVAAALGVAPAVLADAMTRDAGDHEPEMSRIAAAVDVIGLLRDVYGGDAVRVQSWLRQPLPRLGGSPPMELLLEGDPSGVVQLALGGWLGEPD